jgi:adenylate kinase family enzyme
MSTVAGFTSGSNDGNGRVVPTYRRAMRRISVVGNSGSGKSMLARDLADRLGATHLELDSIFHQPGWTELPLAAFRDRVAEFVSGDAWVVDGNYRSRVGEMIWARADTVVWLDYPRWLVMSRIMRRTVRRLVRRERLWNANREHWSNLFRWDPQVSIVRWAWTQHRPYQQSISTEMRDPANARLEFVRLTSPRRAAVWLDGLSRAAPRG